MNSNKYLRCSLGLMLANCNMLTLHNKYHKMHQKFFTDFYQKINSLRFCSFKILKISIKYQNHLKT